MADIQKMKDRLAALLAKAKDGGATTAEVQAAMEQAQKISDKYGITEADIEAERYTFAERNTEDNVTSKGKPKPHVIDRKLAVTIANFCGCKAWISGDHGGRIVYFGMDTDVELAMWLRSAIIMQYNADWNRFFKVRRKEAPKRVLGDVTEWKINFISAFVKTMHMRLDKVKETAGEASNALVVVKKDLVESELIKRGWTHGRKKSFRCRGAKFDPAAYGAGANSANAVDIGRGVSNRGAAQITHGGK